MGGRMAQSERYVQQEDGSFIRAPRLPDAEGATDAAVELAAELGVNLTEVEGTGRDGRITVADVRAAAEA